jgi:hypothetical protein
MWVLLILFLVTLWAIAFLIWLLWRLRPPGDDVHRPPQRPADKP